MTRFAKTLCAAFFASLLLIQDASAGRILVDSQAAYAVAVSRAKPGDTIVLANGRWEDFEILLTGQGKPNDPITLTAETKGKVLITGRSNLRIAGEHLVVSGLVFTQGHSPTNTVIAFRRTKGHVANHSRVTEVVIDRFNNPERFETDFWVMMYGKRNRFDHNHLEGKSNQGVTMAVRLDSELSRENHHRIDHNYFGPRAALGSNGGETLRIGTSHHSLSNSYTVVENNYFDRCNGEVEIVSSKSGSNVFRGNVFWESRGTLTLRHGNDNVVENNVFLGNGVDHTGGIRVINKNQIIRNNYLQGLTGHRFGGALVVMNGVPDSPINRYHQVENALIENNSIIDSHHIELAAGADTERSAPPIASLFDSNLIHNSSPRDVVAVHDDISGIKFENNYINAATTPVGAGGFHARSMALKTANNGLLYPVDVDAGAREDLQVLTKAQTGVSWYDKPTAESRFETGTAQSVPPGEDTLVEAVRTARAGDQLMLAPGRYLSTRIIPITVPITIRAKPGTSILTFERTALFEIREGGALHLDGVTITGEEAPDNAGNSVVRTHRYSMLSNYELHISDSLVTDLDTNHSFNFLSVAKHTFADEISIHSTRFEDITGHVMQLHRETDDLGIYNAEYITITDSEFENIGGTIAEIYRGGTDESTFGPHFLMRDTRITSVGHGKRNKTESSVFLHGAQRTDIANVTLADSSPIRVVETVGEPVTNIYEVALSGTPAPVIMPFQP
ncbi:MAG: polysaccharide lyase 6 family protein [Pseudomonadota bacterium]